ncbi:MAG: YlmH/Sll1252 family protein, partial [Clostridia bacterium]|nr:YlmH/Sll1252 family protein [Clostridia bacterium]
MDDSILCRFSDLAKRADRTGRFQFTPFLGLEEQSVLQEHRRELWPFSLSGGVEGCERVVARFGDPEAFGYEEPYPIVTVRIAPVLQKFADQLTHRDFLGALMNLGIERELWGDILLRDNVACLFVLDTMAGYVCDNLQKVKHTVVKCEIVSDVPAGDLFKTEEVFLTAASARLDCLIAGVFDLPRSQTMKKKKKKKVYV